MALSTNAAQNDFDGTGLQTVISASGGSQSLADDTFSSAVAVTETTLDNSTIKAPTARLVLLAADGFTLGTWTSNPQIKIYQQIVEVDGTNDEGEPDATHAGRYVGRFIIDQDTGAQYVQSEAPISMVNVKKCKFFLKNATGATLDDDGTNGWTVKAELSSLVPKSA